MTHFLNVDLDLVSRRGRDLTPLLDRMAKSVLVMRNTAARGVHTLSLELAGDTRDLTRTIRRFAKLFDRLPSAQRRSWRECSDRCLDIGIQAESEPYSSHFEISAEAVAAAAKLGARIVITVYAPRRDHVP